jgi:glycosyltransferase involved in cell wall biosynthesis
VSHHLILFFTRGVSLRTWAMLGSLEREIALYLYLIEHGFDVSFVTYGDASDLEYAEQLKGIRILCNESGMSLEDYERSLVSLHGKAIADCHVVKTNQAYGAELALEAAQFFRKPFVARCGYMWSQNAAREYGQDSAAAIEARRVEEKVFLAADRVIVTTPAMRQDVLARVEAARSTIAIVPNYVDTHTFRPDISERDPGTGLFVGRIAPEKNLAALLEAIRPLEANFILIGEGKLRPELQRKFGDLDGRVRWEGNVPNSKLPKYLNQSGFFALPSLYEGHPKALIEAMACETPVIGADSPGIRELISHGNTGLLCGTDPISIRGAIDLIVTSAELALRLGPNARRYVMENFSLEKIGAMELSLLQEVIFQ